MSSHQLPVAKTELDVVGCPRTAAFIKATALANAEFAGYPSSHFIDSTIPSAPNDASSGAVSRLDLLCGRGVMTIPSGLSGRGLHDAYYGDNVRPLFAIGAQNKSINFGSFGISPSFIHAARQAWVLRQEADTDAWVRLEGPSHYRAVREVVAKYINTPVEDDGRERFSNAIRSSDGNAARGRVGARTGCADADEIFFVDNLADATNVVARSFLANLAFPLGHLPHSHTTQHHADNEKHQQPPQTIKKERVILYFTNQYPMIKAAVSFYSALVAGEANVVMGARPQHEKRDGEEKGKDDTDKHEGKDSSSSSPLPSLPPSAGTIRIVEAPMTPAMLTSKAHFAASVAEAVRAHEADALVIDHFCWAPTFVVPIVEVCRAVRAAAPGCFIVIDGAHAIGHLSLAECFAPERARDAHAHEPSSSTSSSPSPSSAAAHAVATDHGSEGAAARVVGGRPLFDAYMTNCHKWLMTPRHVAVLWVAKEHHTHLHPTIISNQYRGFATATLAESLRPTEDKPLDRSHTTRVHGEFYWCGTRDMSGWLVLPDVLRYRARCLGGEGAIMRHNAWLASEGARRLGALWGTKTLFEELLAQQRSAESADSAEKGGGGDPCEEGCLVCVRAPTDDGARSAAACRAVLEGANTFAAPVAYEGRQYIRVSAQVYNTLADFSYFAEEYLKALGSSC